MGGRAEGRTAVKLAKLDMRLSVRQLSGRSEPITFAVLLPCLALFSFLFAESRPICLGEQKCAYGWVGHIYA
jgi:hypothetical protein